MSAQVEIVQYGTEDEPEKVVRTLSYANRRVAEKAEDGVGINLDHSRFFTRITEEVSP